MSRIDFVSSEALEKSTERLQTISTSLKAEKKKYTGHKLLIDAAYESATSAGVLPADLATKITRVVLAAETERCLRLDSGTLLNLNGLRDVEELSLEEGGRLKEAVESSLTRRIASTAKEFKDITGEDVDSLQSYDASDEVLMEYKQKVNAQLDLHMQKLLQLAEVLGEILHMRVQDLPEIQAHKLTECSVKSHMYYLRAKLLETKSRVNTFEETSISLDSYRIVMREVVEEQKECQKEINRFLELKERYTAVACKEFDEILKDYLQFKSAIDRKRRILE